MLTTNTDCALNVLIARPEKKAQALSLLLNQQGIACVSQPLFDYQSLAEHQQSKTLLTTANIIIFVSVAAVEFADASVAATHWQHQHIIAVGNATKSALQTLGLKNILCPSQENSEGVLALELLCKNLANKKITIVRGNGGREHLATELKQRGAIVNYLESYQRIWRTFPKDIDKQWYQQQINCIVVTSNALLDKLTELTQVTNLATENDATRHWRNKCIWLVASKRIADYAQRLGLANVIQSNGANDQVISAKIQEMIKKKR